MVRDENGRFAAKEAKGFKVAKQDETHNNYGYYSKVLNKPFDTVEELQKAELEHKQLELAKANKINEKKELAHEVEDAYSSYMKELEDGNKQISEFVSKVKKGQQEAYNKYVEKRNKFIDTYGSFHMTFVDKKPQVDTENSILDARKVYQDTLDNLFDAFKSFPFIW